MSLYHDLIQAHGETAQMRQLQEECGELTAAVSHYLRDKITRYQLACELADVHIMLEQAQIIVGPEICKEALEHKLDRAKDGLRRSK